MATPLFAPPGDSIRLESNEGSVLRLAERLWERSASEVPGRSPIRVRVTVRPGRAPDAFPERLLAWDVWDDGCVATVEDGLRVRTDYTAARVDAEIAAGLLEGFPSFAARTLLEAPAAVLLSRRGFSVLHAGAVVGRRGAVVVRGGGGAGKSTLVAAAWRAGLDVLADESLLVARDDASRLAASVRDLTLLPEAARLLDLEGVTEEAFAGGEEKRRIDLFPGSTPARRTARRAATLLLGPRSPGPARLVPLGREEFRAAFLEGEIPQERLGGDPDAVAEAWAEESSWRLDGALDLEGAVAILGRLVA